MKPVSSADEQVPFALALRVDLRLVPPDRGGVKTPVSSGYRPLCRFTKDDGETVTIGMCQLELVDTDQLQPGGRATGLLKIAEGVAEIAEAIARVGSEIVLLEGNKAIGSARVTAIV